MADGVNKASIRILGQVAGILPKQAVPTGGAAANNVSRDAYVRPNGSADMQALASIIAELQGRVAALESRVSDIQDEETYAPVPLGQLARNNGPLTTGPLANQPTAPLAKTAPIANNAPPAVNNAPAPRKPLTPPPAANNEPKWVPASNDDAPQNALEPATMYKVKRGDTLWGIAERELGDATRWPEIQRANADQYASLEASPDVIQPGWELVLPTGGAPTLNARLANKPAPKPAATTDDDVPAPAPKPAKAKNKPANNKKKPEPKAVEPQVVVPEVLPPETKVAAKPANKPVKVADPNTPVPIDMTGVKIDPVGDNYKIVDQSTKVTGVGTETDTHWEVGPDGKAVATDQKSKVTDADTRTKTRWEPGADGATSTSVTVEKPGAGKPAAKPANTTKPVPANTSGAPVPIDMSGVTITPNADFEITAQKTKVTGVGTETDTHWEVGADGKALATGQQTKVTDADTRTNTRWEAKKDGLGAPQGGNTKPVPANNQGGATPVPIDMTGVEINPLRDMVIESQSTKLEAVDTQSDTHWEVGPDGKALATDQQTKVTAADTVTRTRWVAKDGSAPAPKPPQPASPPAPKPISEAEAVAYLRANLGTDGRISRKEIEAMPAGPGRDKLLEHFDALLFGVIDPGKEGWIDLHSGDVKRLESAIAKGQSIDGLAAELTEWVHADRKPGDLTRDGRKDEADVRAYAQKLRDGFGTEPAPAPAPKPASTGDARLQEELAAYLKEHDDRSDVYHLVKNSPNHVKAATVEQKGKMIRNSLDGFTGEDGRKAILFILESASERGELMPVLTYLDGKKKMKHLFEDTADSKEGAKLAQLFLKHNLYKNVGVVNGMTSGATSDYVKALGWKHPMIGTNDDLRALPEDIKRAFINKLVSNSNFTLTDHRMATWINQHLELPVRIPAYDPHPNR